MNWMDIQVHSNYLTIITDLMWISSVPALFWDSKTKCIYVCMYLLTCWSLPMLTYIFFTFFVNGMWPERQINVQGLWKFWSWVMIEMQTEAVTKAVGPGVAWKGKDPWVSWCCPRCRSHSWYRLGQVQLGCTMILIYGNQILKSFQKVWGCPLLVRIGSKKPKKTWKMDEESRVPMANSQFSILIKVLRFMGQV